LRENHLFLGLLRNATFWHFDKNFELEISVKSGIKPILRQLHLAKAGILRQFQLTRAISRVLFKPSFIWMESHGSIHATNPGIQTKRGISLPLFGLAPGGVYQRLTYANPS